MAWVYAKLIISGGRTFETTPTNLRQAVQAELLKMGYGIDGKPLPKEPEPIPEPTPEPDPEPTPEPTPEEPIETT